MNLFPRRELFTTTRRYHFTKTEFASAFVVPSVKFTKTSFFRYVAARLYSRQHKLSFTPFVGQKMGLFKVDPAIQK